MDKDQKKSLLYQLSAAQNSMQSEQDIVSTGLREHLEWFLLNRTSLCNGILLGWNFESRNLGGGNRPSLEKYLKYKHSNEKTWEEGL